MAEQQAAGVLEVLDRSPPPAHSRPGRHGRRLEGSSEEGTEAYGGEGEAEEGDDAAAAIEAGDGTDSGYESQGGGGSSGSSSEEGLDLEVAAEADLKDEL